MNHAHRVHAHHSAHEDASDSLSRYLPLIVIVFAMALAAGAQQAAMGMWDGMTFMRRFMGLFLVVFAMFKLFDLPGFADGFQMYDLIAKRVRVYALVYPFIELGLGLAYLANIAPVAVHVATLVVFAIGGLGVWFALRRRLDVNCACLGTTLHVPLSTVAVVEDLGMVLMAAVMLVALR
jgi:hypothetical protein